MSSQPQEALPQDAQAPSRPRWGWILVWAALLGLLTLLFFGLQRTQQGPVEIGHKAPDFDLTTFDGQVIRLAELKGKVVVLNFWASWCKPCEREASDLETAWRHYQPSGDVVFLGVDWTDTEKKAEQSRPARGSLTLWTSSFFPNSSMSKRI